MTEQLQTNPDLDLLEQLDKEPERGNEWKPETEGDTILGTITAIEHPKTKDGRYLPVLILDTDNGPTRVAVLHSVLKNELLERKVQTADRIAIRYLGKKTAEKSGRNYVSYRVAVHEEGARDESKAFALEPHNEDSGDDFTEEAEAAVTEGPDF
ncbi:MAG: hypothetical protein R2720_00975 [Candidatus Nanopelagicales bacterium]